MIKFNVITHHAIISAEERNIVFPDTRYVNTRSINELNNRKLITISLDDYYCMWVKTLNITSLNQDDLMSMFMVHTEILFWLSYHQDNFAIDYLDEVLVEEFSYFHASSGDLDVVNIIMSLIQDKQHMLMRLYDNFCKNNPIKQTRSYIPVHWKTNNKPFTLTLVECYDI